LKFDEVVVIQGNYKIRKLEYVKTLLICFNFPILACTPCCGSFGKKKQRTLGVNSKLQHCVSCKFLKKIQKLHIHNVAVTLKMTLCKTMSKKKEVKKNEKPRGKTNFFLSTLLFSP
jgi:hypothetical protein